jgi:hypothetical protein
MTTSLLTRTARPPVAPLVHALLCPLCDDTPDACVCQGLDKGAMERLLEADTVASFTPPWEQAPTEVTQPRTYAGPSWCINANTLRVLPNVVFDRFQRAVATKRI